MTLHLDADDVTLIDTRKRAIRLFLFVTLINLVINYKFLLGRDANGFLCLLCQIFV